MLRTRALLPAALLTLAAQAQGPFQGGGQGMAWDQQRMAQQWEQFLQAQQRVRQMQALHRQQEHQLQAQGGPEAAWIPAPPTKVLWTLPTKTKGQVPTFDGNRLLVGIDDKVLQSLDPDSGKVLWEAVDAEGRACPPLIDGDRVIYMTNDYRLLVREGATGKVLQDLKVDPFSKFLFSGRQEHRNVLMPVVEGGKLLLATYGKNNGSVDGRLHAYDLATWKPLWEYPVAGGPDLPPVVAGDKVIIGGAGHVLAVGLEDGKLAWYFDTKASFLKDLGGSELIEGRYCFFNGSTLFALDPAKGTQLWRQELPDNLPVILGAGDRLVVKESRKSFGTTDWIVALDAKTGEKAWERKVGSTQMPWVQDGRVFCNSDDEVLALDLATGKPQWTVKLQDDPELPFMPAGEVLLTVSHGHSKSALHALDRKDGKLLWTWAFSGDVGTGLLLPHERGFFFPGDKGEVIALR
ncbi:MAG TPA: PQQ-binding-like beta-propeller repeat protein [Holophagaceae bacterium]|nr:PQQ-binding-like beta-propeller repeat protein [Holophagaceae bacterium]